MISCDYVMYTKAERWRARIELIAAVEQESGDDVLCFLMRQPGEDSHELVVGP